MGLCTIFDPDIFSRSGSILVFLAEKRKMGCITSKQGRNVVAASPVSVVHNNNHGLIFPSSSSKRKSGRLEVDRDDKKLDENGKTNNHHHHGKRSRELRKSKKGSSSRKSGSFSFKLGFAHRFVEAEHVAAGWPAWLSSAAGEAVHGWLPLQADAFEKLDKVRNPRLYYII